MALHGRRAFASLVLAAVGVTSAAACYDFELVEPTSAPDRDAQDGPEPSCVAGRSYCGGDHVIGTKDTLYRCLGDAGVELVSKCANGCVGDAAGSACALPSPCVVGSSYCGGDKLDGDPDVLYRCESAGPHTIVEACAKGCVVSPGNDDVCRL